MILAIQALFGTGGVYLFSSDGLCPACREWDTLQKKPNIQALIAELLDECALVPAGIERILLVHGPGPFTAVRSGTVWANVWKTEYPSVQLAGIPSGLFLKTQFPEAKKLILSAGRTAFFEFDSENPKRYTKNDISKFKGKNMPIGGYLLPDVKIPQSGKFTTAQSNEETFRALLLFESEKNANQIFPDYGAEPSITPSQLALDKSK